MLWINSALIYLQLLRTFYATYVTIAFSFKFCTWYVFELIFTRWIKWIDRHTHFVHKMSFSLSTSCMYIYIPSEIYLYSVGNSAQSPRCYPTEGSADTTHLSWRRYISWVSWLHFRLTANWNGPSVSLYSTPEGDGTKAKSAHAASGRSHRITFCRLFTLWSLDNSFSNELFSSFNFFQHFHLLWIYIVLKKKKEIKF